LDAVVNGVLSAVAILYGEGLGLANGRVNGLLLGLAGVLGGLIPALGI
jgi:hypothetical protein